MKTDFWLLDKDKPKLIKATYDGLRKTYPREYYMYFPRWVKEKMSEYIQKKHGKFIRNSVLLRSERVRCVEVIVL
jgi:hypothetical protein